jgi:hypothetical protein
MNDMPQNWRSANVVSSSVMLGETGDRQNLLAASIADRLYSKPCCRVQKNIGNISMAFKVK